MPTDPAPQTKNIHTLEYKRLLINSETRLAEDYLNTFSFIDKLRKTYTLGESIFHKYLLDSLTLHIVDYSQYAQNKKKIGLTIDLTKLPHSDNLALINKLGKQIQDLWFEICDPKIAYEYKRELINNILSSVMTIEKIIRGHNLMNLLPIKSWEIQR